MRKIFLLAITLLKGGGATTDEKGKRRWWLLLVLLIAFGSFAFSVGIMASALYDVLAAAGAADALLTLALGATSVVIFMFGIFYTVSVMYHADDVSLLLALPLRPHQILGAKFLTLVVYEYIFESFILLPVLVAYGIKSGAGALFAVYSVLIFLMLPVFALVIASLLVMIVMRFTRFGKNKQLFNYVGGIIAMVLAIGFNVLIQTSVRNVTAEQMTAIVTGEGSLSALLSNLFPGIGFASTALAQSTEVSGLLNLLVFVLCAGAAVAVFLAVGQLVYFKGLAGVTEASAKRRRLSGEELGKMTASTPVMRAYVIKELRLLVRSPIAFMNCVLMSFVWPVLVVVMMLSGGQSIDAMRGMLSGLDVGIFFATFAAISAFISSANAVTSTAISREGKSLYFTKYIPVSLRKQLSAKVITGLLLSGVAIVLLALIALLMGVNTGLVLIAFVLGIGAAAGSSFIGLLIDVSKPKLSWMNEQQAIKQNMNVMAHMLAGVVFAVIIALPVLLLGMNVLLSLVYVTVIVSVAALVFGLGVSRRAVRKLESMDV